MSKSQQHSQDYISPIWQNRLGVAIVFVENNPNPKVRAADSTICTEFSRRCNDVGEGCQGYEFEVVLRISIKSICVT